MRRVRSVVIANFRIGTLADVTEIAAAETAKDAP
jgi:hypothetical protein